MFSAGTDHGQISSSHTYLPTQDQHNYSENCKAIGILLLCCVMTESMLIDAAF